MKIAIIPARSGSRRIRNKNIVKIGGLPLMISSMISAKKSKIFDKIHLSTDSIKYKKLAKKYNFFTLFLRDKKFSGNSIPVLDAVKSDLQNFEKRKFFYKEICVLSATSPLITHKDIIKVRKLFVKNKMKYPILSVCEYPAKIERALKLKKNKLEFINKKNIKKNTYVFQKTFYPTGNICYLHRNHLMRNKSYDLKYIPYFIDRLRAVDIDELKDLNFIKKVIKLQNK